MNDHNGYHDSGFEWIGKIPNDWTLSRVGKYFIERSEKVDDVTYPPLSVTMSGIVDQLSDVAKTNDGENRKLVKKHDFVINSRSDRKGSSGIAPRDGSVSLINIVLEPHDIDPQFIQNLFKSYYFKEEFFRNGKGIHWDLWTTRWDQFKNINIPIPPQKEQKLISRYLDKKTNQIDSLINKIEKKIELLKEQRTSLINQCVTKGLNPNVEMKDSGVEWIGEIPIHWNISRLVTLGSFTKGKNITKDELTENGDPVILYSHLYTTYTRATNLTKYFISKETSFEATKIPKNTFLFTSSGESVEEIGKTLLYHGDSEISVGGDMVIFNLKPSEKISPEFLSFSLNSDNCQHQKSSMSRGEIVVHVYEKQLREVLIPIPPFSEQIQIKNKLERHERDSANLINYLKKKIEILVEFRQSLISSAVTGKVRVTEGMI